MTLTETLTEGLLSWWGNIITTSKIDLPNYQAEITKRERRLLCLNLAGTEYLMQFLPANNQDKEAFKEKQRKDLSSQGKRISEIGKLIGKMQLPEVAIAIEIILKYPVSEDTQPTFLRILEEIRERDPLKGDRKKENERIFGDLEIPPLNPLNPNSFLLRRPLYRIPREGEKISEILYWQIRRTMLQPLTLMY